MFQSSINYGGFDTFLSKKLLENSINIKIEKIKIKRRAMVKCMQ